MESSKSMLIHGVNWMPTPAFAVDAEGRIIAWNRWMQELTETEAADVVGLAESECAIPFHGDRNPVYDAQGQTIGAVVKVEA